jgi:hypothetical protein
MIGNILDREQGKLWRAVATDQIGGDGVDVVPEFLQIEKVETGQQEEGEWIFFSF